MRDVVFAHLPLIATLALGFVVLLGAGALTFTLYVVRHPDEAQTATRHFIRAIGSLFLLTGIVIAVFAEGAGRWAAGFFILLGAMQIAQTLRKTPGWPAEMGGVGLTVLAFYMALAADNSGILVGMPPGANGTVDVIAGLLALFGLTLFWGGWRGWFVPVEDNTHKPLPMGRLRNFGEHTE